MTARATAKKDRKKNHPFLPKVHTKTSTKPRRKKLENSQPLTGSRIFHLLLLQHTRERMKKRPRNNCSNTEVYERVHHELKDMFFAGDLTDIDLCNEQHTSGGNDDDDSDAHKISAHRVVLAAASPYFRAMFSSGMEESRQRQIVLPCIETHVLETIVSYMYSGELAISGENVFALLEVSNLFEMTDIVNQCCCKLMSELNADNCLHIRDYAEKFSTRADCATLFAATEVFLHNYFLDICHTPAFLQLEFDALVSILQKTELCVIREENVVTAALVWIQHDITQRQSLARSVFQSCVRLSLVAPEFLTELALTEPLIQELVMSMKKKKTKKTSSGLVKSSNDCPTRTNWSLANSSSSSSRSSTRQSRTRPNRQRKAQKWTPTHGSGQDPTTTPPTSPTTTTPYVSEECPRPSGIPTIYAMGGCNGRRASRSIEVFDLIRNEWRVLSQMKEKRSYFGSAVIADHIYVVGGHNDNTHLHSVERYDPERNTWTACPPMLHIRSYLGLVACAGKMYAIGGYDGEVHTDSVECYDPEENRWHLCAHLNTRRSGLAASVVGDRYIYVMGGFDGQSHLQSVERYDTEADVWTACPPMLHVRNGPGAVTLGGELYVVGGEFKHGQRICAAEKFNPEAGVWTEAEALSESTSGHGLAVLNDTFLFALGGSNQQNEYLRTAQRFDELSREWHTLAPMTEMRCGLSVLVVSTAVPQRHHQVFLKGNEYPGRRLVWPAARLGSRSSVDDKSSPDTHNNNVLMTA